jgi:hypothetical protein
LYDVAADPYQMNNIYFESDDATKIRLHTKVTEYYACKGAWPQNKSNCP